MSADSSNSGNQPPWFPNQPSMNSVSPPSGPPLREDQIVQAIRFLRDNRTQSASQQEKESFLRQKGLSDAEIAAAISRSSAPAQEPTALQRPIYVPPPVVEEPILWSALKSIFGAVGAIAIGVIGYQYYLETTKKDNKEDNRDSLISPWGTSSPDPQVDRERIDKLAASVESLKSEQALRHKELILSIRELTSVMRETNGRKPGGTVYTGDLETVQKQEDHSAHPATSSSTTEDQPLEAVDIPAEVAKLFELGIDSTMQFILSSPEKNKKLNKTNPRFEKFAGSKLLRFVGYKEDAEFFTLTEAQSDKVEQVIEEIKKQRTNRSEKKVNVPETVPQATSSQPMPPWLVPKSSPEIEELNP